MQGSLTRLFNLNEDYTQEEEADRSRLHSRPGDQGYSKEGLSKSLKSLKCDAALGCGSQESHSYKARLRASGSREANAFDRDRRIHASKASDQKFELLHIDDTIHENEWYENGNENENEDEDEIVYRVCQYSTGSRYGYLIDRCAEPKHSLPPPPASTRFTSRARQIQDHATLHTTRLPGVRVELTLGTITLAMIFLLLVAIMLVEIVDIISDARGTSPEIGRRGRSRTRRVIAQAFSSPRKLFIDTQQTEPMGLGLTVER